jgi:hypothetical protein
LRAAGGEGKSTALLQAAVHAAREGGWAVLLRQSSDVRLNPELIDQLSPDQRWLIVADDAEGLVEDVWKAAEKLNQSGSRHVMFLLAARDTDWRNAKGDKKPWATRLGKRDDLVLGKLSAEDAGRVVDAWSALGDDGLRALKNVDGRDAKISRLLKSASSGAARTGEGSFFGGLLDTRFGAEGLVGHMTILLESLKAAPIDGGNKSLYDALVYIANAHAVRKMPGIDNKVLAALCGVARHRVSTAIINPLGREIGAAQSHGFALTRHPRVADAIVIAANNMGTDLGQVWSAMVATTVTMCTNPGDTSPQYFNYMMHCAGKLMKDLPQPILQETRGAAGIDTGHMTMRVRPKRVDAITNCARAYRVAGFPSQAFDLMKTNFPNLKEKGDDWGYNVRGYFLEWGVCSGNLKTRQGSAMGAWLAAFALSDALAVELELDTAMKVCTGIGVSMLALQDDKPDGIFSLGARAATKLGWQTSPDDRAHGNLLRHETEINKRGTKLPADNAESINWLIGAARAAWDEIKDRDLRNLKNDGQLRFEKLRALLAAPAVPRRR